MDPPSVEAVACAFAPPPEGWKGYCKEVAGAALRDRLVPGQPVHGCWRGPVAEGNRDRFPPEEVACGMVRHSWIECPDGTVCDPTRWVFEDAAPSIFCGLNGGEYLPAPEAAPPPWRRLLRRPGC